MPAPSIVAAGPVHRRRAGHLLSVLAAAILLLVDAISGPAAASGRTAQDVGPATRWIDVNVATLWVSPGLTRAVDTAASSNPARPRTWLAAMTLGQRKWLNGKLETQALYGQRVEVLASRGSWSQIVVADQPTPRHPVGYPGWLPTEQLALTGPFGSGPVGSGSTQPGEGGSGLLAVVRNRSAWLYSDAALTQRHLQVSYGTQLPVATASGSDGAVVDLLAPGGLRLYAPASSVLVRPVAAGPAATGAAVVAEARKFLGLAYLWGGTSGFGFDCSGLTHTVYRTLGVTIPRDAGPQFAAGVAVPTRKQLRAGDLVFFKTSAGTIHHVGIAIGGGRMIHSPRTGKPVAIASLYSAPWSREFAGGRRYINATG